MAVANPLQVYLIARAKTKTDKIDARVLTQLYAAGFLPEVWMPDTETQARRRQVTRRNQLVKSRVRLKGPCCRTRPSEDSRKGCYRLSVLA